MLILYGRGLIAEEYCRYLERRGLGGDIVAFAVTKLPSCRSVTSICAFAVECETGRSTAPF